MTEHAYYRKKPVTVAAIEYTGVNFEDVSHFVDTGGGIVHRVMIPGPTGAEMRVSVRTLEGVLSVSVGDYVIRGVAGEFYPCKPGIFKATYDKVDVIDVPETIALT